jgi:hypothetical protein
MLSTIVTTAARGDLHWLIPECQAHGVRRPAMISRMTVPALRPSANGACMIGKYAGKYSLQFNRPEPEQNLVPQAL